MTTHDETVLGPRDGRPRVLFVVPTFNAGDTTRGIEIARAIQNLAAETGREASIGFVFPRSQQSFEEQIRAAGFQARPAGIEFANDEVAAIMRADHDGTEFITDRSRARQIIEVLLTEFTREQPDLIVFGFMPPVGIAAQILGIPSVSYTPFPVYRPWARTNFLLDVPDEMDIPPVQAAPSRLRRGLTTLVSRAIVRSGFFRQPTLAQAGRELGWKTDQPDLFGMLDAGIQLVNDLPVYYEGQDIGPHTRIAGPLFSRPADQAVPEEIARQFARDDLPRVFVSMGSSGEKPYLLTAIEAVSRIPCRAVVIVPPHVCTLGEARERLSGAGDVLLTDRFLPAPAVNAMADIAVIHGGQGTVQTAVYAGTPVVGIGMQWEQSTNLGRLVQRGSAIRIPRSSWRTTAVEEALRRIIENPAYAQAARELKHELDTTDGYRITGELIWELLDSRS